MIHDQLLRRTQIFIFENLRPELTQEFALGSAHSMANSIVSQVEKQKMNRTFTKYKAGMEEIEVLVHGAANLFKPGSERLSPARAVDY